MYPARLPEKHHRLLERYRPSRAQIWSLAGVAFALVMVFLAVRSNPKLQFSDSTAGEFYAYAEFTTSPQCRPVPQRSAETDNSKVLILWTGSSGGNYHKIGCRIAKVIQDETPYTVLLRTSSGSWENARALADGEADLAIAQSDVAFDARKAETWFHRLFNLRGDRLRAVMGLHYEEVLLIARESLHLRTTHELKTMLTDKEPLRVAIGPEGSGTRANATIVLEELITHAELDSVPTLQLHEGIGPRAEARLLHPDRGRDDGEATTDLVFLTTMRTDSVDQMVEEAKANYVSLEEGLLQHLVDPEERPYYVDNRPLPDSPEARDRRVLAQILEALHQESAAAEGAVVSEGEHTHDDDSTSVATVSIRALLLARADLFSSKMVDRVTEALLHHLDEISLPGQPSLGTTGLTDGIAIPIHPAAAQTYCDDAGKACAFTYEYWRLKMGVVLVTFLGIVFMVLGFSKRARRALLRLSPKRVGALVGPDGVTGRYRKLLIPVFVIVLLFFGSVFVQMAEIDYARERGENSEFVNLTFGENLIWMIVFAASGFDDQRFPLSVRGKVSSALIGLLGITGVVFGLGVIASDRFARSLKMELHDASGDLDGHVIICGWNKRGPGLVRSLSSGQLQGRRRNVVVVAPFGGEPLKDEELATTLVVDGSPSKLAHLSDARLDRADVVVVLADENVNREDRDAKTLFITSVVEKEAHRQCERKQRNTRLHTVVELTNPENRGIFEAIHVNQIVCGQEFDQQLLAHSVLNPGLSHFMEEVFTVERGSELIEVPVSGNEKEQFEGKTFDKALLLGRDFGVLLVSIHRNGAPGFVTSHGVSHTGNGEEARDVYLTSPPKDLEYEIKVGDSLLFLAESEAPLEHMFGDARQWRRGFRS